MPSLNENIAQCVEGGFYRILLCLLICLMFNPILFVGCKGDDKHSKALDPDMETMVRQCSAAVAKEEWRVSDSIGELLVDKAIVAKSDKYLARGRYYCGLFRPGLSLSEMKKKKSMLDSVLTTARETEDDSLACMSLNGLAIWEMSNNHNYALASHYLKEALGYANDGGMETYALMIESNLSELYRLLQDTLGHKYDLAVYHRGRELGNSSLATVGAYHCADYEIRHNLDSVKVSEYIGYIRKANERPWLADILEGEYYLEKGKNQLAQVSIGKALAQTGMNDDEKGSALMLDARLLNMEGRYADSNEVAGKALESFSEENFGEGWIDLYGLIADNYSRLSRYEEAYSWKCKYQEAKDSVEGIINREAVNKYKIEFEVEKKNQELALQKERMKRYVIVGTVVFIAMLVLVLLYHMHVSNRKQYYKNIVRQYKEALGREEVLRERLALAEGEKKHSVEKTATDEHKEIEKEDEKSESSAEAERGAGHLSQKVVDDIFRRIMNEIENNEIYRDPSITRESFAAKIGCNRTYFSEAIKCKTGMSYSQFMNDCRVHRAVEILSGKQNDISMKQLSEDLGFLSQPTFFTAFKRIVGMSPAVYRKTYNQLETNTITE